MAAAAAISRATQQRDHFFRDRTSMTDPAPPRRLPTPPIFIVGHARSGTTWLFEILTGHPEVAGVFESWMFTRTNGLIPLFRAHWGSGALAEKAPVLGRRPGLGQLMTREELARDIRALSEAWLARALGSEDRYVVEKGPGDYQVMHELFPEARFIHILRDGRDVAVSMHAASRSWAPEMRPHIGKALTGSATLWREEVMKIRSLGARPDVRFLEVRYEDLHANPIAVIQAIFDFCALPYSEGLLADIRERTAFDRHRDDPHGFRRRGQIGEWRERFGIWNAIRFDRVAGDALLATGYVSSRWWWLKHRRLRQNAPEPVGSKRRTRS